MTALLADAAQLADKSRVRSSQRRPLIIFLYHYHSDISVFILGYINAQRPRRPSSLILWGR